MRLFPSINFALVLVTSMNQLYPSVIGMIFTHLFSQLYVCSHDHLLQSASPLFPCTTLIRLSPFVGYDFSSLSVTFTLVPIPIQTCFHQSALHLFLYLSMIYLSLSVSFTLVPVSVCDLLFCQTALHSFPYLSMIH